MSAQAHGDRYITHLKVEGARGLKYSGRVQTFSEAVEMKMQERKQSFKREPFLFDFYALMQSKTKRLKTHFK